MAPGDAVMAAIGHMITEGVNQTSTKRAFLCIAVQEER
jgi:hypothetical protein